MIATWLFDIGSYRYSTQAVTYSSVSYTTKILPDSFPGITMGWDIGGSGLIYPTDIEFDIDNADGVLTRGDLEGEFCTIKLLTNGTLCRTWKFEIQAAILSYGKITVYCVGILQKYLTGNYPNTPHPREVWVSANHEPEDGKYDDYRIPVIFGTAYIPSMYIYHTVNDTGYYVLGADIAYTVTEVTAPPESGKTVWPSSGYTFNQTSDAGYKLVEFVIAPTGTTPAYTEGTWPSDQKPLVKYAKTSGSTTAPATIISTVLQDFGVPSGDIDTAGTFASAATTYASQGITWNGGFYQVESRESVLSNLLAQCDSTLFVSDKIELRPFSKTSKETFTTAKTKKLSYRPSKATQYVADSGHVAWADAGFPQENLVGKAIVPINASTDNPDSEVFECRFVGDDVVAQTLGTLYFQRKLGGKDSISFSTPGPVMSTLATLKPADVITVNDTMFGGSQAMIVSEIQIERDLTVNISGRSLFVLQEFADITPSAVVVTEDTLVPNLGGSTSGLNSATVTLYQRAAAEPSVPSTTSTYTFSTGILIDHNNGWTQEVPTVDGNPLWFISSVAAATAPTDTDEILTGGWSDPVIIAQDGINTATIFLYQRKSTAPALTDITDPVTYTFATKAITESIGAWSITVPSGTAPLYITAATAANTTATDSIDRSEWSTPVIMAQDGTIGTNGKTYVLNITGGVRTFLWNASGSSPVPTASALTGALTENGSSVTPTYAWTTGGTSVGLISGSGSSAAFTPTVASTWDAAKGDNWAKLTCVYSGQTIVQTIPISCTKIGDTGTGTTGANGDSVDIVFIRSSTAPSTPAPSTGVPSGWYTDVAGANTAGGIVIALWSSVGKQTAGTGNYTWETPSQVTGASVAVVTCYVRASSAPATPTTGGTYTFSSPPVFVAPTAPITWYTYIPSGTDPVYTSRAVVSTAAGNTAAVAISSWTSPVLSMQNGTNGTAAQYVVITGEQAYKYTSGSSTPTPTSITLTAALFGGLTTYDWEYYNGSWTNLSGTNTNSTYALAHDNAAWSTDNLRVRCQSNGAVYDEVTMVKLRDGTNTVTGYLTNENHTVAALVDGTGYSLTTAGGTFKVYSGITDVTTSSTFAGTATKNGLTFTINASTGVYTLSGTWTTDSETFSCTATYNTVVTTKVYSISKAKAGAGGTPGVDATNWSSTVLFTASDYRTVTWGTGSLKTGTSTYSITSTGTTGAMTAATAYYIYFDVASPTVLTSTSTMTNAVGTGKVLVAVAYPNATTSLLAQFQAFNSPKGVFINADNIAATCIGADKIAANTITAAQMAADLVSATTMRVQNGGTADVSAGMTGVTAGDTAVRFWAGSTYANRNTAPFRVTQAGAVYVTGSLSFADTAYVYYGSGGSYMKGTSTYAVTYSPAESGYVSVANDAVSIRCNQSSGTATLSAPSGTVYLTAGTAITVNRGITFPGTAVLSTDANTLDDYEEGTYTPSVTCGSGSVGINGSYNQLSYTKVGRAVTLTGQIRLSSITGPPSGAFYITLPTTAYASSPAVASGFTAVACVFDNVASLPSPSTLHCRIVTTDNTRMSFVRMNATVQNFDVSAYLTATTSITINCTYLTTT